MSDTPTAPKRSRPVPGAVTVTERRIPICLACGFAIDDIGGCEDGCPWDDSDNRPDGLVANAVYEVTHCFLRDEPLQRLQQSHNGEAK